MSDITKYNCVNLREPTSCLMFHVVRCVLFLFSERSEKCVNKNAKENKKNKSVFHSENCIYLQSRGKETKINKKMRKRRVATQFAGCFRFCALCARGRSSQADGRTGR